MKLPMVAEVYKGCKVDYSGDIVTAQLFLDVLTSNTTGAKGKDGKRW